MSLKGTAYVKGEKNEIEKMIKDYEEKKPPPQVVIQSVSNVVFIESIMISRSLNIPPPIPLPQITQGKTPTAKSRVRDYSA
jgi:hypothetical protein